MICFRIKEKHENTLIYLKKSPFEFEWEQLIYIHEKNQDRKKIEGPRVDTLWVKEVL